MESKLDVWKIREIIAESGKTRINDILRYFKSRYEGQYDSKVVRLEAKDMILEMKKYM